MKIHTLTVIDTATGQVEVDEFYDYDGPLAHAGGKGGGSQTTVQKSDPWAGQQPYLSDVFGHAQQWYNSGTPSYYPGQTVANQSDPTRAYINDASQLGSQGSTAGNAANNQAANVINGANLYANPGDQGAAMFASGGMLGANPYLNSMYNSAADGVVRNYQNAVAPGIDSQMEAAGRFGSGAHANEMGQAQQALGNQLGNMGAQMYGNAYQQDEQNMLYGNSQLSQNYNSASQQQLAAMGLAPSINQMDWQNLSGLQNAGNQQDQYNQSLVNADVNKWNYGQNLPLNKLQQYEGLIQGNYGGTSSTSTPLYNNGLAQGIGTLGMVGSLFGGMGDAAAAGGGLMGGLGSLLAFL